MLLLTLAGLSLVFLVSGVTKLSRLQHFRQTLEGFQISKNLIPFFGYAVPLLELAIAAAMFIPSLRLAAGLTGLTLLMTFTAVIGYNLLKGRTPSCNCFGALSAEKISNKTIYRNIVLIIAAILFCISVNNTPRGLTGLMASVSFFDAIITILLAAILAAAVFCAWFLFHLFAQQGRLLLKLEKIESFLGLTSPVTAQAPPSPTPGLRPGELLPDVMVNNRDGQQLSLREALQGQLPAVLFFAEPDCGPCKALITQLQSVQPIFSGKMFFVVITSGPVRELEPYGWFDYIFFQQDREVFKRFGVSGTPSVQIISPDGTIARPMATGTPAILELMQQLQQRLEKEQAPRSTEPPPSLPLLILTRLDGRSAPLREFKHDLLLIFWNPHCGYCQRMQPGLVQLRQAAEAAGRELVVISSGTATENNALNEVVTVLLQNGMPVMSAFAVSGTPSAILYNADGYAQSGIAVGEKQITALLTAASTVDPVYN